MKFADSINPDDRVEVKWVDTDDVFNKIAWIFHKATTENINTLFPHLTFGGGLANYIDRFHIDHDHVIVKVRNDDGSRTKRF